jgi:alkaline phosphatase D
MPIRAIPGQAGRIYRKVAYGPLLDVFLIVSAVIAPVTP